MSADDLIAASTRIRHDVDFQQAYGDDTFLLAVADWLDAESQSHIHRPGEGVGSPINLYDMPGIGTNTPAMRLARAYLNESA